MTQKQRDFETISFGDKNFKTVEAFPSVHHEMVLPLLLIKGDEFRVIGTAFVINTQAALAVTAAHCIAEAYGEIAKDRQITETEGTLCLGYLAKKNGKEYAGVTQVVQLYMEDSIDIAILKTKVPVPKGGKIEDSLLTRFLLDFQLPENNEKCLVLGYNKDTTWKKAPDKENYLDVCLSLKASQGHVEEMIFDGAGGYFKHPMFRLNARVDCGMSGGPVISARSGSVIGIVSRGFHLAEGEFDGYTEHISHTCGMFPICVQDDEKLLPFFKIIRDCEFYSTSFSKQIRFEEDSTDLKVIYPSGHTLVFVNFQRRFTNK